jgi:thiol:disulfide interchange protein DsbC
MKNSNFLREQLAVHVPATSFIYATARAGMSWAPRVLARQARNLLALALATSAVLVSGPVRADAASDMEQRLRALYPTQRFDSVRAAALPGFYEVQMGKSMAYVDPTGRYFLFGGLFDMQTRRDLTAERRAELEKIDPRSLPANLAITFGSGARRVNVFSDPNCGYCKQLERTLVELSDVTVHVYPVPILGEPSRDLVARIWCSPDRAQAWRVWMTQGRRPTASADCGAPLDALQALAEKAGVQGTPTLVSADGRKAPGALSLTELQAWIGPALVSSAARSGKTAASDR